MPVIMQIALVLSTPLIGAAGWRVVWMFPAGRVFIADICSTDDTRAANIAAIVSNDQ
jgi:hypothetical protein